MTTDHSNVQAHCRRSGALAQRSHGNVHHGALGAVDGHGDRVLVGRCQALRASELADGITSRSGAQL